ncbi:hypothetical protein [Xanthomonas campestris]|uniref:hypothetical protein n=1 Tax=Xanthomonas campestris TaxID=339 RepID=UPI00096F0B82|nr:hypothetical protein [Xanthomonas campestris]MCF8826455.1 DUF2946 domain-containing protein [Xanthomonas campestris pv. raphani]QLC69860.1 DUF2946 domain-containing protein [Xanthomonas campestris pv. raphani]WDJ20108.1 DUF2946 domain-containing protein [Xanthomonas campestris pv. raphani]
MLLVIVAPLISRTVKHAEPSTSSALSAEDHQGSHIEQTSSHPHHHDPAEVMDTSTSGMAPFSSAMHAHPDADEDAAGAPPLHAPHAEHDMGVECDYCVIAARLISLLVAVLLLLTHCPGSLRRSAGFTSRRQSRISSTLGARGPPSVFSA